MDAAAATKGGLTGRAELIQRRQQAVVIAAGLDGRQLAEDARFTMPPLPAWFDGLEDVGRFLTERVFATPWRLVPTHASGQLAFACYQRLPDGSGFRLGGLNVLTLRGGKITEITGFVDPAMYERFELPAEFVADR